MAMKKEEMVGTHSYQAPEVLEAYAYSERADIYSIALIFLFMLKGKSSFVGANKFEILSQMK
jgi:serine/threonine protein kinase